MQRETRERNGGLHVAVSAADRARIKERAMLAGLSVSAYRRPSGLGHPIRSVPDYDAVLHLARLNGDQGRPVGLLKL